MITKKWPDWAKLVLGLWLIATPFVLQHSALTRLAVNEVLVGIAIAAISAGALRAFQMWEGYANTVLGLWLLFSPWVLRTGMNLFVTGNLVIVALLIVGISMFEMTIERRHLAHRT